ncbi:MAG: hydroxymethylbilane synthase [Thermoleophilaceae bacterium]|jgi:hydroxymethylbilane synthase|nr:hydroxymethylbilane synthase [Thermoleophilaceae bacterium]
MLEHAQPGLSVELVTISTSGDEGRGKSAAPIGDKSRFVKEIEQALLDGEVDLAVHSAKDVPGVLAEGLAIVGVPAREDARDALVGAASLDDLPAGAGVGTSSLRRRSQLLAARPDLKVEDLRGNVDTRLRRLDEGRHDAVVLALAGLRRLGRDEGAAPLDPIEVTPAPGQGCLALEARRDDANVAALADRLTDGDALVRLTAERALTEALEASCNTPVGAYAEIGEEGLLLAAFVGSPDGSTWIRDAAIADPGDPAALGVVVAERMLAAGAADVLEAAETAAVS